MPRPWGTMGSPTLWLLSKSKSTPSRWSCKLKKANSTCCETTLRYAAKAVILSFQFYISLFDVLLPSAKTEVAVFACSITAFSLWTMLALTPADDVLF